jgi:hypothetical protein
MSDNNLPVRQFATGLSGSLNDDTLGQWVARKSLTGRYIKDAHAREVFEGYLQHLANGGRTNDYLDSQNIVWVDMAEIIWQHQSLTDLQKTARKIGQVFRKQARLDEAHRRAVEGSQKPVFHRGEVCGYVTEYSDQLLAMLLKADDPDRFTDRKTVRHEGVMLSFNVKGIDMGEAFGALRKDTSPRPPTGT